MEENYKAISREEVRLGGVLLSIGALVTIVCILLEVKTGWASLTEEIERTDYEAGIFLYNNWSSMKPIWSWSMFGNLFLAFASLVLLKSPKKFGWLPTSFFWVIYFVGSLLLAIAFGLCVGSYYQALEVIEEQPELFNTVRGAPLYLFNIGVIAGFVVLIIFFHEGFSSNGVVHRTFAIVILIIIIASLAMVALGLVSVGVFAISCFLAPLVLGIYYLKTSYFI